MRQPHLLPESLPANDIEAFIATLGTHRDRAMVLAMLLGGCGRRRYAACCWPMWTWAGAGCG
ncbi:phage integrase family domain protein [Mycobacterium xenopi 4042]|uniref:Phage integrase family domain protein n=1 Tax=Mycobacterium xenopi 4042 TaxID=1299334 RepID=X7Z9K3_MYCXE|nr:phage integrase family domain protein [Mycobacterium xenopi 4042]